MITSQQRKEQTEAYLKEIGVPFVDHLPVIENEQEARFKTAQDVAKRLLILTYLNYVSEVEEDKNSIVKFFVSNELWDDVSECEKKLLTKTEPFEEQEKINISWQSEGIKEMLWCLGKIDVLELPSTQTEIPEILDHLPQFFEPTQDFINSAALRSKTEILNQCDLIYRIHWAVQNDIENVNSKLKIHPNIVRERHCAINWVRRSEQNWDDITLDV